MRISLLRGRTFEERDVAQFEQVVIINDSLARRFWPGEDPLGKRISLSGPEGPWQTVVGVVGDVRHGRLEAEAGPEIYRPYSQSPIPYMALVVQSELPASSVANLVRSELLDLDGDLPVYGVRPMGEMITRSLAPRRFQTVLLGSFAGVALVLSVVGIYGVVSYSVAERTREFGIRLALGARSQDVLRLVIRQGMWLATMGTALGLLASLVLTRLIQALLFGVSATDLMTFAGMAALLVTIALMACYVPARRATKVDPTVALRYE
jgi:putative ABC transport system permease protein